MASLVLELMIVFGFLLYLDWFVSILVGVITTLTIFYYYRMSKKQFGGITGDLAGFFVTLYELIYLWVVVIGNKLIG